MALNVLRLCLRRGAREAQASCVVPDRIETLSCDSGWPPVGLCIARAEQRHRRPLKLYFDLGQGFQEAFATQLLPDANGEILNRVYLPLGLRRLGLLDPAAGPGARRCRLTVTPEAPLDTLGFLFETRPGERTPGWLRPLRSLVLTAVRLRDRRRRASGAELRYRAFLQRLDPDPAASRRAAAKHLERIAVRPLISIVMPTYNTPERWLRLAVASVRAQVYPHWELCIADDSSSHAGVAEALTAFAAEDPRVRWTRCAHNGGIAAASNRALEMASGEFVTFLDHDDELHTLALYHAVAALAECPDLDLLYTDEDKIDAEGRRYDPHFKPRWNPVLLDSINYVAHLAIYRRERVMQLGGLRSACDGSQDYDLVLRYTAGLDERRIHHIPALLYHWRAIPGSTAQDLGQKSYPHEAGMRALSARYAHRSDVSVAPGAFPTSYRLRYQLPDPAPRLSIIIPTRDGFAHLGRCLDSVLARSTYPNLELLLIDNQSRDPDTLELFTEWRRRDPRLRLLHYDAPFNFSAINNYAAAQATGQILLLLNDDTEVLSQDWLEELAGLALQDSSGAVGAKLLYPDGTVQHGGVALGIGGVAGHVHLGFPRHAAGYMGRLQLRQQVSAVTAACLAVSRDKYLAVGGLDERNLRVAFNDIDFCLRLAERGWRNIWTPWAELYHHESKTRGPDTAPDKRERFNAEVDYMQRRWGEMLADDPYYHRHFSRIRQDYSLTEAPVLYRPWLEQAP